MLLDAVAAYRLTRLATADVITRPARAYLIRKAYEHRDGLPLRGSSSLHLTPRQREHSDVEWDQMPEADDDAPKLADFVKCRWCTGVWISGLVVVARRYCPRAWDPLARLLALSAAAALLAGLEQE